MDILRRAFRDIAAGHSRGLVTGKIAYIKHLGFSDHIGFDQKREEYFDEAKKAGLPTEEEKLVILKKQRLWSDEQEKALEQARLYVIQLNEGKRKNAKMPSMVKGYAKQIAAAEREYENKLVDKKRLLEITCEVYADRCVSDYYIISNIYQDAGLTVPFFTEDQFDMMSDETVTSVVSSFNATMEGCSYQNIRKLAMNATFQQYFQLVGDNLQSFFGKPICGLTDYQLALLREGAHFRHIYSTHDTSAFPKNVMEDPDLLSDYAAAATKGKEDLQKQGAFEEGTIVVGMKKEDKKALGMATKGPDIAEIMTKHGGNVLEYFQNQR
jgi:hypothetical protein